MSEYYENPAPPYREMKKDCFLIIKLKMSIHPSLFILYLGFLGAEGHPRGHREQVRYIIDKSLFH